MLRSFFVVMNIVFIELVQVFPSNTGLFVLLFTGVNIRMSIGICKAVNWPFL